jgi:outer membrane protein OmpA-like peptidoglycan-associated protein
VSEDKKVPGAPPPDDFSKTTPNINIPGNDSSSGATDWDKTNYNFPKQPSSDNWGKTVANIRPIDTGGGQDFDKTYYPGAQKPSTPEWGMTEARIDMSPADFGSRPEDFGGTSGGSEPGYGKTTPYFRLPEAERAKYEKLPPTPTEQAAQAQQEKKGGIPSWFWIVAGLFSMFFFAVIVLAVVYFLIIRTPGFEATVKGAPPGSSVRVNGSPWGVTDENGSIKLQNLKGGETKKVEILHPSYKCESTDLKYENGVVSPDPIIARCQQLDTRNLNLGDCSPGSFQPGEFDKAELCYNKALDSLDPDSFTAQQLVDALNILIINFDSGKSDVPPARLAALQKGAGYIKRLQQRDATIILEVGGHTDNVGGDASNQTLSQNRANAVKDVLVRYGVNAGGLQIRGYGAVNPKYDNSTEQGKFLNRRIGYSIVNTSGTKPAANTAAPNPTKK